jgi:peptidoglycan/LPS O-acetylase OafA/YrhL
VEIFFVISGFLIMGSAVEASPVYFLERRFARLYPAAMACALINCAVLYPFAQVASAYHLNVGHSLRRLVDSILLLNGPLWSARCGRCRSSWRSTR